MQKALISIDYTYDFVADDGKLTAGKPAQAISDAIYEATKCAFDRGDYIFFAIDAHDPEDNFHPETKLFPPHNIIGTSGRDLFGPLNDFYQQHKDDSHVFWMDKRHYSSFSGTDLDIRLRERGINTVILTGVLTDICGLTFSSFARRSCVAVLAKRSRAIRRPRVSDEVVIVAPFLNTLSLKWHAGR